MLQFLRKHQSYIFVFITFIIVISFSFFGTYNAVLSNPGHEQIAFTAIDGTAVKRHEVEELALFIGTDQEDKWLYGGIWGPNFLNDGVIKNDFLSTGLAEILVAAYPEPLQSDLQIRLDKEKRYALYVHPQAKFFSVEGAWASFAPQMKPQYDTLRSAQNPLDPAAFKARVGLFLSERQFPAPFLRQVLLYQQKQHNWLPVDPNLEYADLSLFGYHTAEDWFGPHFVRLVAEFIINSSKIAEEKGYQVSNAEVLADLLHNAEVSFRQNQQNPHLGVTTPSEYFDEQLRRLGMDHTKAVKIWRQVLLFRRFFQDVGNAVVTDPLTYEKFYAFAQEQVEGSLYRLPKELQFADYRTLQKFEIYLDAVSKRPQKRLLLPTTFLSVAEVKKSHPELIQKRYILQVAQVQKSSLTPKVGLKEMWAWEAEKANWDTLKKEFPELGLKKDSTREERVAALDSLDDRTRLRVDLSARHAIVDAHPEWIQSALSEAPSQRIETGIRLKGGQSLITGLENREELIKLLDAAPLQGTQEPSPAEQAAAEKLAQFTADNKTHYAISVLERLPNEEVVTFAEANQQGILDILLDQQLDTYYAKVREENPTDFQKEGGGWKSYSEAKDKVADLYFEKILKEIREDYAKATGSKGQQPTTGTLVAPLRFYAYSRQLQDQLKKKRPEALKAILLFDETAPRTALTPRASLTDQWKLEKHAFSADRSSEASSIDIPELFALSEAGWTKVHTPVNGDLYFFELQRKGSDPDKAALAEKLQLAHQMIADDAQRTLTHHVVQQLKDKHAISLDYLDRSNVESITTEENTQRD